MSHSKYERCRRGLQAEAFYVLTIENTPINETALSNLVMDTKMLSYEVNEYFKTIIEYKNSPKRGTVSEKNDFWCGSGDSNPRPHPWQGCALNN